MGIGTLLTRHVARIERSGGVRYWETHMLADNAQMSRVMGRVGSIASSTIEFGVAS